MSKSLGNFYTVNELLAEEKFGGRKWPGEVLRLAMLMTHYREPIDFSLARLEEAEAVLSKWKSRVLELNLDFGSLTHSDVLEMEPCSKLVAAVADDINMSAAMAELHRHAGGDTEQNLKRLFGSLVFLGLVSPNSMVEFAEAEKNLVADLGIDGPQVEREIAGRLSALASKDYATADKIRDELLSKGIQLKDGKDPETGDRVTTWEIKR